MIAALTWMSHSQNLRRMAREHPIDLYMQPPVTRFRLLDYHLMDRIVRDSNRCARPIVPPVWRRQQERPLLVSDTMRRHVLSGLLLFLVHLLQFNSAILGDPVCAFAFFWFKPLLGMCVVIVMERTAWACPGWLHACLGSHFRVAMPPGHDLAFRI